MAKKKPNGRYRIVMMTCGYVESAHTSWLVYHVVNGIPTFKKKTDAVKALALDMYFKYVEDVLSHRRKSKERKEHECCDEARAEDGFKFCPKCGTQLWNVDFDGEEFKQYIISLHGSTADSYGEAEGTTDHEFSFWPWFADELIGAKKNEVVFIPDNAEDILIGALYEQKPELMSLGEKVEFETNTREGYYSAWQEMKKEEG